MKKFCITVRFFDKNSLGQPILTESIQRLTSCSIIQAFRIFAFGHDFYRICINEDDRIISPRLYCSPILRVRNISTFVRNLRISRNYAFQKYVENIV